MASSLFQHLYDVSKDGLFSLGRTKSVTAHRSRCALLALPRELRDLIWTCLVRSHFEHLHAVRYGYEGLEQVVNLLVLSRQINQEILDVFHEARGLFVFERGDAISGMSRWRHRWRRAPWHSWEHTRDPPPKILMEMSHISIFPFRNVYGGADTMFGPDGQWFEVDPRTSPWHQAKGVASALSLSAMDHRGWHNVDAGLAQSIANLVKDSCALRSLEIPAVMLLNISVVRAVRHLRNVNLHFAFSQDLQHDFQQLRLDKDSGTSGHGRRFPKYGAYTKHWPPKHRKWLGETGDIDLMLPVYMAEKDVEPAAMVPLSSLALAVKNEVAGSTPPLKNPGGIRKDFALWYDFTDLDSKTCQSLNGPPSSGWYRYSASDPGVCCLIVSPAPEPSVFDMLPAGRHPSRHAKRAYRRQHSLQSGLESACLCSGCEQPRKCWLEKQRSDYLRTNRYPNYVVKGNPNGTTRSIQCRRLRLMPSNQ